MAGEQHGRGMGTACYVWIGYKWAMIMANFPIITVWWKMYRSQNKLFATVLAIWPSQGEWITVCTKPTHLFQHRATSRFRAVSYEHSRVQSRSAWKWLSTRDIRRLTTWIRSEKCDVRRFHCCANVLECTYTNLDSIAYYTPSLYGIAYCC